MKQNNAISILENPMSTICRKNTKNYVNRTLSEAKADLSTERFPERKGARNLHGKLSEAKTEISTERKSSQKGWGGVPEYGVLRFEIN